MDGSGPGIHKNSGGVEDGDHQEVGGARREGFLLPCGHAENGGQNASVGQHRDGQRQEEDDQCQNKVHQLRYGHVCAGEVQHWRDVTEEVIDDIGATEAKARDEIDFRQGDAKANGP